MSKEKEPLISVIVPNFNYARFLDERIDSIRNQTVKDLELIILDDASTDASVSLLEQMPRNDRVRVFINEVNSGNVFKQWNAGITLARGKYVWIAEVDDTCQPNFLETLLAKAEDERGPAIVYCQSMIIDENGTEIESFLKYTNNIDSEKWLTDYWADGETEIRESLSLRNTIPNVSACIFRRSALLEIGLASTEFALCGDWMTYVRLLEGRLLAFCAAPLNRYRRHPQTVRASSHEGLLFTETYRVLEYIFNRMPLSVSARQHSLEYQFSELLYYVGHQARGHSWISDRGLMYLASKVDADFELRLDQRPEESIELKVSAPGRFFLGKCRKLVLSPRERGEVELLARKNTIELFSSCNAVISIHRILYSDEGSSTAAETEIALDSVAFEGGIQILERGPSLKVWLLSGGATLRWPYAVDKVQKGLIKLICSRDVPLPIQESR